MPNHHVTWKIISVIYRRGPHSALSLETPCVRAYNGRKPKLREFGSFSLLILAQCNKTMASSLVWTVWSDSSESVTLSPQAAHFHINYVDVKFRVNTKKKDVEDMGSTVEIPVINSPLKTDHVGPEDCIATNFWGRSTELEDPRILILPWVPRPHMEHPYGRSFRPFPVQAQDPARSVYRFANYHLPSPSSRFFLCPFLGMYSHCGGF